VRGDIDSRAEEELTEDEAVIPETGCEVDSAVVGQGERTSGCESSEGDSPVNDKGLGIEGAGEFTKERSGVSSSWCVDCPSDGTGL